MLGTQASGTQVELLLLAINSNGSRVDIGHPAPCGMSFGMAHIAAEHR